MSQDLSAMVPALEDALKVAPRPPELAAAVALARRYARLLDAAAVDRKYVKALKVVVKALDHYVLTTRLTPVEERAVEEAGITVATALAEHSVASDLGPKFLAALAALNMTLASTKRESPGGSGGDVSPVAEARAERERLRLINGGGAH